MKATHQCPKCDSFKIVFAKGSKYHQGTSVPLKLSIWNTKNATLNRYICADCGYTESYVFMDEKTKDHLQKMVEAHGDNYDEYV